MDLVEKLKNVSTKDELVFFIAALRNDLAHNPNEWLS